MPTFVSFRKPVSAFVASRFYAIASSSTLAAGPLEVDAKQHRLEFENDLVRVIRAVWAPGKSAAGSFDAPGAVIVALTPLQFEVTLPDGQKIFNRAPAGAAMWFPAGRIRPRNEADTTAEFVVVEPKAGQ